MHLIPQVVAVGISHDTKDVLRDFGHRSDLRSDRIQESAKLVIVTCEHQADRSRANTQGVAHTSDFGVVGVFLQRLFDAATPELRPDVALGVLTQEGRVDGEGYLSLWLLEGVVLSVKYTSQRWSQALEGNRECWRLRRKLLQRQVLWDERIWLRKMHAELCCEALGCLGGAIPWIKRTGPRSNPGWLDRQKGHGGTIRGILFGASIGQALGLMLHSHTIECQL
mmetsp:Transcript_30320/g.48557  ORF Transcript_30320/g.48557 Transcript_30320/m.48557 type:complete len:224 (+) Transcript_30320:1073-1744(+)